MHVSLRTALLLVASFVVAVGACGGNVVVDTPEGATGGATTTTTTSVTTGLGAGTTTGFGASTTTGFGASTTTGFGASSTTTTGTGFASSSSVSVSVSSSSGTGGSGACTDASDATLLDGKPLYPLIVQCAEQNLGNTGAETMCIEGQTGLTPGCTACVVDDIQCSLMSCIMQCESNPNGEPCLECRNTSCAAPFTVCSGFAEAPGSTTCAAELLMGTKGMGWRHGLPAEAFVTDTGFESYQLVDQCACQVPGPCAPECVGNFCSLSVATSQCLTCLETACSAPEQKCDQN